MLIKVCGMRQSENIRAIEMAGADFMGFIFHSASPRFVDELPSYMPTKSIRTGVFVSDDMDEILRRAEKFHLDALQLHGTGNAKLCTRLREHGFKVLRAFGISSAQDFSKTEPFEGSCDYFLFDTACENHGGSGRKFDWQILDDYTGGTPFFLSGGIDPSCAPRIKALGHRMLCGVDINSGFETTPGVKDAAAVTKFINEIR